MTISQLFSGAKTGFIKRLKLVLFSGISMAEKSVKYYLSELGSSAEFDYFFSFGAFILFLFFVVNFEAASFWGTDYFS